MGWALGLDADEAYLLDLFRGQIPNSTCTHLTLLFVFVPDVRRHYATRVKDEEGTTVENPTTDERDGPVREQYL